MNIQILLNDQPREIESSTTLEELLAALEVEPARVAIELNRALVRRGEFPTTRLASGDRLELVTLVGGG
jgi:thiamine biosynthesis protein ThiS